MIKQFKLSDISQFIKDNYQMLLLQKNNFDEDTYNKLIETGFLLTNLTIDKDIILFEYKQCQISTNIKPYEFEIGFNDDYIENHILTLLKRTDQFKSAFRDFKLNQLIKE
jgi:hypothetical protein